MEQMNNDNNANMPVKKIQAGAISSAVWENIVQMNGQSVPVMSVTFERRYKHKDGTWKSTNSLKVNDIPKAILVLNKAYEYMLTAKREERQAEISPVPEEAVM